MEYTEVTRANVGPEGDPADAESKDVRLAELHGPFAAEVVKLRELQHKIAIAKGMAVSLVKAASPPEQSSGDAWDVQKQAKELHIEPRLLRIYKEKHSKFGEPKAVPLDASSLNHGDCFILDTGTSGHTLYIWNGMKSSPFEKASAESIAKRIKDDRQSSDPKHHKVEVKMADDDEAAFWGPLGGKQEVKMEADPTVVVESESSGVKLKIQVRVPRWARLEKPCEILHLSHSELMRIHSAVT
jgi:hypothetical protein